MSLILTILLIVHGLIHLYGFVSEEFLREGAAKSMAWRKIIHCSRPVQKIIGVFWLVACGLLCLAALGLLFNQDWWKIIAICGVILSQLMIILYIKYAWFGTITNAFIIASIIWLI